VAITPLLDCVSGHTSTSCDLRDADDIHTKLARQLVAECRDRLEQRAIAFERAHCVARQRPRNYPELPGDILKYKAICYLWVPEESRHR
jgi:hypothetical protein